MITAEQVKKMREETGMGMQECKAILLRQERLETLRSLHLRILDHSQHDPIAAVVEDLISFLIEEREK